MARPGSEVDRRTTRASVPTPRVPAEGVPRSVFVLKTGTVIVLLVLVILAVTGLIILNLGLRASIARDAMAIHRLGSSLGQGEDRRDRLRLERVKLRSVGRIEELAVEELNMIEPRKLRYIVLPPELSRVDEAHGATAGAIEAASGFGAASAESE